MKRFVPMGALVPHILNKRLRVVWNGVRDLLERVAAIETALVKAEILELKTEDVPAVEPTTTETTEETTTETEESKGEETPATTDDTPATDEPTPETEELVEEPKEIAPAFDIDGCYDKYKLAEYAETLSTPLILKLNKSLPNLKAELKNHIEKLGE